MMLSRNFMLALTMAGGAAVAALLAIQSHARRVEAKQDKTDLQQWEGEGGAAAPPVVAKRQS